MKGFIPVEIYTKEYIKAYIHARYGPKPVMTKDHGLGSKLYDVLQHSTNEDRLDVDFRFYTTTVKVYIPIHVFKQRGARLNETNIRNFNLFAEKEIKSQFNFLMDTYIAIFPSFEGNLATVRKQLGVDEEAWPDDSLKKQYYRYRKANGKALLKPRRSTVSVPCVKIANLAF